MPVMLHDKSSLPGKDVCEDLELAPRLAPRFSRCVS